MSKKKKAADKVRLVLLARADQVERLAALSKRTGAVQSELVRRAIDLYLSQEEAKQ
jgi:predicted DNA-binding protein